MILAWRSPFLMALPDSRLLEITRSGLAEVGFRQTPHFRLYEAFARNSFEFLADALQDRQQWQAQFVEDRENL
jgi:predicted ATPase